MTGKLTVYGLKQFIIGSGKVTLLIDRVPVASVCKNQSVEIPIEKNGVLTCRIGVNPSDELYIKSGAHTVVQLKSDRISGRIIFDVLQEDVLEVIHQNQAEEVVFDVPLDFKGWELRKDRVIAGKTIIPLNDVVAVTHGAPISRKHLGIINLWIHEGTGNMNFHSVTYPYSMSQQGDQAATYIRQNSNDVFTKLGILGINLNTEIHVRCNACGEVYTFTPQDINEKLNRIAEAKQQEKLAKVNSIGAISNALGGTLANANLHNMQAAMNKQNALNAKQGFIDYSKCIHCFSSEIEKMSEEQWRGYLSRAQQQRNATIGVGTSSAADELLKFKELLDMGVITQEEFDAKKKQLLGL